MIMSLHLCRLWGLVLLLVWSLDPGHAAVSVGVVEYRQNTTQWHLNLTMGSPCTTATRTIIRSPPLMGNTSNGFWVQYRSTWLFNLTDIRIPTGAALVLKDADTRRTVAAVTGGSASPCGWTFAVNGDRLIVDYIPPASSDTCSSGSQLASLAINGTQDVHWCPDEELVAQCGALSSYDYAEITQTCSRVTSLEDWAVTAVDRSFTCSIVHQGEGRLVSPSWGWIFNMTKLNAPPLSTLLIKGATSGASLGAGDLPTVHKVDPNDSCTWAFVVPMEGYRIDLVEPVSCDPDTPVNGGTMLWAANYAVQERIDSYCANSPRPGICINATAIDPTKVAGPGATCKRASNTPSTSTPSSSANCIRPESMSLAVGLVLAIAMGNVVD